jgi:hypothetical protein
MARHAGAPAAVRGRAGDRDRTGMASLEDRAAIKGLTCADADLGIWASKGRK